MAENDNTNIVLLILEGWYDELRHRIQHCCPEGPARNDAILALESSYDYARSAILGVDHARKEHPESQ